MLKDLLADRFAEIRMVAGFLIFGFAGVAGVLAQAPMVDITPGPGTIAITGGKLLTITHGVIENGVVLIEGGKIAAVGTAASVKVPKGATIVEVGLAVATGMSGGLRMRPLICTTSGTAQPVGTLLGTVLGTVIAI
jgi:hypothetical protein